MIDNSIEEIKCKHIYRYFNKYLDEYCVTDRCTECGMDIRFAYVELQKENDLLKEQIKIAEDALETREKTREEI